MSNNISHQFNCVYSSTILTCLIDVQYGYSFNVYLNNNTHYRFQRSYLDIICSNANYNGQFVAQCSVFLPLNETSFIQLYNQVIRLSLNPERKNLCSHTTVCTFLYKQPKSNKVNGNETVILQILHPFVNGGDISTVNLNLVMSTNETSNKLTDLITT